MLQQYSGAASMGRKSLSGEPKGEQLRIRLTDAERAAIDEAAGDEGSSTWARRVLLAEAAKIKKRKSRDAE